VQRYSLVLLILTKVLNILCKYFFNVLVRLAKEKISYEKEADKMQEKLEKMKRETPEDYMIKKQVQINITPSPNVTPAISTPT